MYCQLPTILALLSFCEVGDILMGLPILAQGNFRVGPQIIVPGWIAGISKPGGDQDDVVTIRDAP